MKTSLIKGLNADDAQEIKGLFIQALRLRRQLTKVIEEKITDNATGRLSRTRFEEPSWAYYQADANGYERALKEVISILSDEKEK